MKHLLACLLWASALCALAACGLVHGKATSTSSSHTGSTTAEGDFPPGTFHEFDVGSRTVTAVVVAPVLIGPAEAVLSAIANGSVENHTSFDLSVFEVIGGFAVHESPDYEDGLKIFVSEGSGVGKVLHFRVGESQVELIRVSSFEAS